MTIKTQNQYTKAESFLIDTRKLPPELRWKISGIVEAADVLNRYAATTPDVPDTERQTRDSA